MLFSYFSFYSSRWREWGYLALLAMPAMLARLHDFDGLFNHIQSRFLGIRFADRRTIRLELDEFVLAGIVTRPFRQAWTIRIAGLGEVGPVSVHQLGNLLV